MEKGLLLKLNSGLFLKFMYLLLLNVRDVYLLV